MWGRVHLIRGRVGSAQASQIRGSKLSLKERRVNQDGGGLRTACRGSGEAGQLSRSQFLRSFHGNLHILDSI